MTPKLTARQQEIYEFIRDQILTRGMPPTRQEIGAAFGFASPNAAETHLRALAQKGVILMQGGAARGIRLAQSLHDQADEFGASISEALSDAFSLPLVGRVAAGSPILATEHIESQHKVDPALFAQRADYLLRVRGMSMRDAGILDGDLLAVHSTPEARDGQIVVARIDDEVTVKRLQRQRDGCIALLAENPDFSPIVVDPQYQSLAIEGIAVGLIREGFGR